MYMYVGGILCNTFELVWMPRLLTRKRKEGKGEAKECGCSDVTRTATAEAERAESEEGSRWGLVKLNSRQMRTT